MSMISKQYHFTVNNQGQIIHELGTNIISITKKQTGLFVINFEKLNFSQPPCIITQSLDVRGRSCVDGLPTQKQCVIQTFKNPKEESYTIIGNGEISSDIDSFTVLLYGK
jgi:hypothetical protein